MSSSSAAIENASQNKIVRTFDGTLHKVYVSGGRIWYEYSTDNGATWNMGRGGSPIGAIGAHSPSISECSDEAVVIVYQETDNIKLATANKSAAIGLVSDMTLTASPIPNAFGYPVVAVSRSASYSAGRILVVWLVDLQELGGGLEYKYGHIPSQALIEWKDSLKFVPGSDRYAITPTIAAHSTKGYHTSTPPTFHIAWERSIESNIYYRKLSNLSGNTLSDVGSDIVSAGSGYTYNMKPSIITYINDGIARVCWVGKRWEGAEEGLQKSFAVGEWKFQTMFSAADGLHQFWTFGDKVNSVDINKNSYLIQPAGIYRDTNYIVAWSATDVGGNLVNKYTRNSTLGGTIRDFKISGNIMYGKDVQVVNGTSFNNMHGFVLNTQTSPYPFKISDNITTLGKEQMAESFNGREGVVFNGKAQFYFAVGDIVVNNESVEFEEIADTVAISNEKTLNTYLVSKPFILTDNSDFSYAIQYGFADSLSCSTLLTDRAKIAFSLQLIDDENDQVLGEYDKIEFSEKNILNYKKSAYRVDAKGIGKKSVRLALVVHSNEVDVQYSLSRKFGEESSVGLSKSNARIKTISYQGTNVITDYTLDQNYPNPFNPTTTISYALPKDGMVAIKVYDALGREVKTLINEFKTTGRYTTEFDATDLSSGIYLYKIVADKYSAVKKMLVLK